MAFDKLKLRSAIKKKDGWWASLFSGPIANRLLEPLCENPLVTPNKLTFLSLVVGIIASMFFAMGHKPFLVIGGMLVQFSFIIDCMDGQLARYRGKGSNFGAWFDRVTDRVKDFFYFFGLAWGYFYIHKDFSDDGIPAWMVWPLAMLASFFVFLIDYYVNQDMKLLSRDELQKKLDDPTEGFEDHRKIGKQEPKTKVQIGIRAYLKKTLKNFLKLGMLIYKYVPILRFNIGEQVLIMSVFCFFGASLELIVTFVILGGMFSIYWPLAKLYGFLDSKS